MGIIRTSFTATCLLLIVPSYAEDISQNSGAPIPASEPEFFAPYQVTYSTLYKKGITLKVEGTQTLTKQAPDLWQFNFHVDTLLASLKETSLFSLQSGSLRPTEYHYSSRILGKRKNVKVAFDWDEMVASNTVKDNTWKMPIDDISLDRLTLQLQLRYDLLSGREQLAYNIADGGKLKQYTFETKAKELVQTKLGELETIKVIRTDNLSDKRHQYFWFAPKLDYLLVKMEHFEKGESYTLNVDKVEQSTTTKDSTPQYD